MGKPYWSPRVNELPESLAAVGVFPTLILKSAIRAADSELKIARLTLGDRFIASLRWRSIVDNLSELCNSWCRGVSIDIGLIKFNKCYVSVYLIGNEKTGSVALKRAKMSGDA